MLRWLDQFPYKHPRFGIPNLIRFVVLANVVVFIIDAVSHGTLSSLLAFSPALVLHGEIWRLFTFVLVPEPYSVSGLGPIWFVLSMLFYYSLGSTLEQFWGKGRFTLFYLSGNLLTVIASFVSYGLCALTGSASLFGYVPITAGQINFSILLAFATVFPDQQFRIYFLIPIKAKWLAVLYVALRVWSYLRMAGATLSIMLPVMLPLDLAALVNYLLFFHTEVGRFFRRVMPARARVSNPKTINFKDAQRDTRERKGYLHKCTVCGRTDTDYPDLEFRYCSKCNGYYCYCIDHINNHVHIQ